MRKKLGINFSLDALVRVSPVFMLIMNNDRDIKNITSHLQYSTDIGYPGRAQSKDTYILQSYDIAYTDDNKFKDESIYRNEFLVQPTLSLIVGKHVRAAVYICTD